MAATAYTSPTEMVSRYGVRMNAALSGADGNVANADSVLLNARLLKACESGNARVDAVIIGRYAPADVITNQTLVDAASTLAFYHLAAFYRPELLMGDAGNVILLQVDRVERTLADIAAGKLQLTFEPEDRTQALASPGRAASGTNADGTRRTAYSWMDEW